MDWSLNALTWDDELFQDRLGVYACAQIDSDGLRVGLAWDFDFEEVTAIKCFDWETKRFRDESPEFGFWPLGETARELFNMQELYNREFAEREVQG